MSRRWTAVLLCAGASVLAGCAPLVDRDQPTVEPVSPIILEAGHPVGQTFVASHAGLSGVEVWLGPMQSSPGEIRLHLRSGVQAEDDLATASLSLAQVTSKGFYRLSFSQLNDSHGNYYYFYLDTSADGATEVGAGPGGSYINGALHQDHEPVDAQMAFRLVYDAGGVLLGLVQAVPGGVFVLVAAGLLYVVPGWALLAWLLPDRGWPWAIKLGVAASLSLALYPLLLIWTSVLGLRAGALHGWLPAAVGAGILLWRYRMSRPAVAWQRLRSWSRSEALWPDTAFVLIALLLFASRLLAVRSLEAPMWGDSYQHSVMSQLLVDNGGLFASWQPYAPYESLTVHFGFPAAVAAFSWTSGTDAAAATLLVGQIAGVLAVLALYPLALRVSGGNRWAGVGAVLVAGLLSPMPAYYVNWGRYAQLAGQAVLPGALWLVCEALRGEGRAWRANLLAGVSLAGMSVTYYRMPFYYVVFLAAWLIGWGVPAWRSDVRRWLRGLGVLILTGGLALAISAPWFLRLAGGHLAGALVDGSAGASSLDRVLLDYAIWRDILFYVPGPLLLLAAVSLVWCLIENRWNAASVGLWALGLSGLRAATLIGLPGADLMQSFAVLIAFYIPIGLLVGWLVARLGELARRLGSRGEGIAAAVVLVTAAWGAVAQIDLVQASAFALVTRPDVRAMTWIRQNTHPGDRFLVEAFRIYGGVTAVGSDAGWWIPLLAGRENTMPPQYALMNEVPARPEYSTAVVDLVAALESDSPVSPQGLQVLCDWGITHIYVGQGQGEIGLGAVQLFSPKDLAESPWYATVYREDRVRVFALKAEYCEGMITP